MEEIDLCWRLQALGLGVWNVPTSIIYHYGKQTIKENTFKSHYLNHRNSWILFLKNNLCLIQVELWNKNSFSKFNKIMNDWGYSNIFHIENTENYYFSNFTK